ncbi:MAG: hypothetical protein ACI8XO_000953 [Verrucomicrobiales bacterium]|jgi:hypothetical protein
MHLVVTTLAVMSILVVILRGMFTEVIDEPLLTMVGFSVVGLLVGAMVFSFDIFKFRRRSAREIGLTADVLQVELSDGRRVEAKWGSIRSAASNEFIWTVVTSQEEIAFSVAGLTYREQSELGMGIADMVAQHRQE